jgi:hypothetical protein
MEDWDAVVAYACTLPGVVMESYYGDLVPKHNGKALVAPGDEPGSFVLMIGVEQKAVLIETDPAAFWETDHYRGWPAVLVRYGKGDRERIEALIARRWWDTAKRAERSAFGPRP